MAQRAEFWPPGDGPAATRIRAHDWASTALGPTETWPAELRVATMFALDSADPAALFWDANLAVIPNDDMRPFLLADIDPLGADPAMALGPLWSTIEPAMRRARDGHATTIPPVPVTIDRDGQVSERRFSFAFRPVRRADGAVAGVLAIASDTTADVAEPQIVPHDERYCRTFVTTGAQSVYRMSADWKTMHRLDGETLSIMADPIDDWADLSIPPTERASVFAAIDQAIATRSQFELEHRVWLADGTIGWMLSRAVPFFGPDGEIVEWFGSGRDVTGQRSAIDRARADEERQRETLRRQIDDRTAELEASRNLLRATMDASTDMIQVFEAVRDASGEIVDFTWVLSNKASDARNGQVCGARLLERNPGVIQEGIFDSFKRVTETGQSEQAEFQYVHEQFDGWFLQATVKLGDGVATTCKEISDLKGEQSELSALREASAHARLLESEERLRQYGEASQDVLWMRDADTLQWEYLTPAFEAIYGISRAEIERGDNFESWLELILPEDRAMVVRNVARMQRGERITFEFRIRRPSDGKIRWLRETDFPMTDEVGRVVRIGGIGHDITELKNTERALAAAELRQRALLEGIPQLVWRAVDSGEWTWASPQWTDYTGQCEADSHDWGWLATVHPEDHPAARQAWASAAESGGFEVEYRIRHAATQEYRWFTTRASAVRGDDGRIVEWLGTCTEIDELRSMQERQRILVAELQHRTRNLIAVVRTTADKTMRSATGLGDFREGFRDRLGALARVQGLLSRLDDHDRVTFDELLRTDLAALGVFDDDIDRVTLNGPEGVRLRSSSVQTLAMALHELATNAAKYGALHQPDGRLDIAWHLEWFGNGDEPWLHIDWRESGVVMPERGLVPEGSGQGRELIERALPYQLKAKTSFNLGQDGVHCTISVPVSASSPGGVRGHA